MVNFFSAAEKTVYCITVSKRHITNCLFLNMVDSL